MNIEIGQKYTNGTVILSVIYFDDSGVMFNNGYCPNMKEFKLQWKLIK